jgi:signal transduction histidine kinase
VTDEDLQLRLDFLGFTDEDRKALVQIHDLLESRASGFVDEFYRHLLEFDATRELLTDPELKKRLLAEQRSYLMALTEGEIDKRYAERRSHIGLAHERVGLEPRWYLGGYALYLRLLVPMICQHYEGRPEVAERTVLAMMKLLFLDAQLAMESYIRRREEQLEYLARELAASSRELQRSYDEQSQELRQTTRRARAAEELAAVGTLVAGLAHEIGTPMGVIQGHAEMLESSVADDQGRWRLETIREQIDRISEIIQTLLNMARPQPLQRGPVDLAEVIRSSLDFMAERLRRSRIDVSSELDDLEPIQGDRQKLQQLFLNLFLNAADAMPEGGTLRASLAADGDDTVRLTIADSGTGIPAGDLDRIFEPFYSTKPSGKGSGLGLMVARTIVEEHGGSIEAQSEEGSGTEFIIRIPLGRFDT